MVAGGNEPELVHGRQDNDVSYTSMAGMFTKIVFFSLVQYFVPAELSSKCLCFLFATHKQSVFTFLSLYFLKVRTLTLGLERCLSY